MVFDYPAKSGKRRIQAVVDPLAQDIVCSLKRRRGGGDELLAFKDGRTWVDVRSDDINAYLKAATGDDFSAKDFRTWSATVIAALALAVSGPAHGSQAHSASARSRARSRRPRTTWATRPRSAARPTSTRASSTPTAAASCSTRR